MRLGRRSFLKLGAGMVAAPAFIRPENLDFGVPTTRLLTPAPMTVMTLPDRIYHMSTITSEPVLTLPNFEMLREMVDRYEHLGNTIGYLDIDTTKILGMDRFRNLYQHEWPRLPDQRI